MVWNAKELKRPFTLGRTYSRRSSVSSSSRRSFSSWDPDASVRMFTERSRDAALIDEVHYLASSETESSSGRNSPEPSDYPSASTDLGLPTNPTPITERNPFAVSFSSDMPTSDLVAAAREAADLVAQASDLDPYPNEETPVHLVGYGTLPKKEVKFRRPVRAAANRYAASNRRYVDILT
ncbi:hypothetical protein RhiJN_10095 [Ceratobasidium sp. AG-Ba]|nr:hypothetical protein RhiJN_10095 [Ceratobasidium sp. AG-Ba]QRW10855.1 hypothetical protein RhiLY_09854 [Ceratobasidium sp. AG-Ba]